MMRNYKIVGVAVLIGLVLAATGAWTAPAGEEAAAASEKPMVTDPTTGMPVTAPEYGGTLTYPYRLFGETVDPSITGAYAMWQIAGVNEKLVHGDWGPLPRRDKLHRLVRAGRGPHGQPGRELDAAGRPDADCHDQTGHSLAR